MAVQVLIESNGFVCTLLNDQGTVRVTEASTVLV
jgi:hypothetical protein